MQESKTLKIKLDNGRLHLWHMLEFHKWNQVPFPEDPMPLIFSINSPNMQKYAFSGYRQLLESTILWLAKLDGGVERFAIITKREEGMSEEEYNMKVQEDSIKSRTNRMPSRTSWLGY